MLDLAMKKISQTFGDIGIYSISEKKGTFTFPLATWWKTIFGKTESKVVKAKTLR